MSKRFAQTISGMVGTSDNEKRYIHKKLADFESSSNKAESLSADNLTSATNYPSNAALATVLGKWGKVSQTITWSGSGAGATYALSNITEGLIPQELINQAAVYGVTFNTTTGYFEFGGYTDIAADEMREAICKRSDQIGPQIYYNYTGRIILPFKGSSTASMGDSFFACSYILEIPAAWNYPYINPSNYAFRNCRKLQKIGAILLGNGTGIAAADVFLNCDSLQSVRITLLDRSITCLQNLSHLDMTSLAYIINNSTGTNAKTITLHPDVYAAAQADADVQAALVAKPLVTLVSA